MSNFVTFFDISSLNNFLGRPLGARTLFQLAMEELFWDSMIWHLHDLSGPSELPSTDLCLDEI